MGEGGIRPRQFKNSKISKNLGEWEDKGGA